jgi:recombination protein RecA
MYGQGISREGELLDLGARLGLIEKSGAWFTVGETRLQGRDSVKEHLRANPDIADGLEQKIRRDAAKLMTPQARAAAIAAGGPSTSPGGLRRLSAEITN